MSAIQLRGYQEQALAKLRSALARNRRVVLHSPTGSGKTEMGMAMIRGAVGKGKRVAFIANRKELVRQASRRLDAAGIAHGILQADNTRSLDARVLVCSIDTVHRRGLPDDVGLILIDEAHAAAGSVKYRELLFKYNLVPVVGLSATPFSPGLGKPYRELGGRPLFAALVVETAVLLYGMAWLIIGGMGLATWASYQQSVAMPDEDELTARIDKELGRK